MLTWKFKWDSGADREGGRFRCGSDRDADKRATPLSWLLGRQDELKEKTNAKRGKRKKCGSVIQSEQKAGYRHRDDSGGGSIQRDDRERGGDSAPAWMWRKTLFFFFLLGLSSVGARFVYFVELIGVREGDWDGEGRDGGNRCSALLGWMHTGEGHRENPPF